MDHLFLHVGIACRYQVLFVNCIQGAALVRWTTVCSRDQSLVLSVIHVAYAPCRSCRFVWIKPGPTLRARPGPCRCKGAAPLLPLWPPRFGLSMTFSRALVLHKQNLYNTFCDFLPHTPDPSGPSAVSTSLCVHPNVRHPAHFLPFLARPRRRPKQPNALLRTYLTLLLTKIPEDFCGGTSGGGIFNKTWPARRQARRLRGRC